MASKEDIQYHYDVDNDFFKLFLDQEYRVYSCGVWENATNLEEAQKNKLARIAKFSQINPGGKVLDIGCGWGGMMDFCLNIKQAEKVVGLTLSQDQFNYITQKNNHKTTVHLCSWKDFNTHEKFDSIISVGAMEHFASLEDKKHNKQVDIYRDFFEKCYQISTKEAYLGLQTIVTFKKPDSRQTIQDTRYLLKYVFPGSVLPEIKDIQAATYNLYEPVELRTIGLDYALTLTHWKDRLVLHKKKIIKCYGETLWMHYNNYFNAAKRSFENGYISLLQISLRKV